MTTRKNITGRKFRVLGFDNGNEFTENFTLEELLSNSSNDSELLYTIQENHINDIIDLSISKTLCLKSVRDDFGGNDCVIVRLS